MLVGCGVPIPYYIYKSGAAIGCRLVAVALRCQLVGVSVASEGVGGAAHALQLSGVGCADHVGAVVSWSGLVAHLVGGAAAHVGRLVAFLVALRCVGWLSVGRGAAVIMSGGSRLSCGIRSGCRLLLMVSPDVGRVSRSSCRDRLPLLFVVSWSGGAGCSSVGCRCSSRSVGRGAAHALRWLRGVVPYPLILRTP